MPTGPPTRSVAEEAFNVLDRSCGFLFSEDNVSFTCHECYKTQALTQQCAFCMMPSELTSLIVRRIGGTPGIAEQHTLKRMARLEKQKLLIITRTRDTTKRKRKKKKGSVHLSSTKKKTFR